MTNSSNFKVIVLDAADLEQVYYVNNCCWAVYCIQQGLISNETDFFKYKSTTKTADIEAMKERMEFWKEKDSLYLGIKESERLIAYCVYHTLNNNLKFFYVLPEFQGREKGCSQALMDDLLKRTSGAEIKLAVRKDNERAIKFYARFGFKQSSNLVEDTVIKIGDQTIKFPNFEMIKPKN